jgi:NTP pyrophosphatase (non-canonical NTP hydrolase)
MNDLYPLARITARWLSDNNVDIPDRILMLVKEVGEVSDAWLGMTGGKPRKGYYGSKADVARELGDVVICALTVIESLGFKAEEVILETAEKIAERHRKIGYLPS